jgi:hypothetical protein
LPLLGLQDSSCNGFWVLIFPSLCFIVLKLVENWSLLNNFKMENV